MPSKLVSAPQAAAHIADKAVLSVSSSSALGCPDLVLRAIGERFEREGRPRGLTALHPIAAGDMYGVGGIDHLAQDGLLATVLAGSYLSGPSKKPMLRIWRMIVDNKVAAYKVPSGIMFDMHREAAARRPGVVTKVGIDRYSRGSDHLEKKFQLRKPALLCNQEASLRTMPAPNEIVRL